MEDFAAVTGIEFNQRVERIPVYPAARTWDYEGELVELASNETPWGPPPAVVGALQGPFLYRRR